MEVVKKRKNKLVSSETLSQCVVQGMQEKKAEDIVVLDLRGIKSAVTDYFVICSGNSDTQVDAIMMSIEEQVYKNLDEDPWHKEGKTNKEWILLDYVDVVAHVFKKDKRTFYALEDLWGDAPTTRQDS
jgi:ribosome-associated protein